MISKHDILKVKDSSFELQGIKFTQNNKFRGEIKDNGIYSTR